ncbi:hypothetical protein SPRG_21954, partial [Saprolegnia parasitica CBS 223.65]
MGNEPSCEEPIYGADEADASTTVAHAPATESVAQPLLYPKTTTERTLYDALLKHTASRVLAAMDRAARKQQFTYDVANLSAMLAQTSYVTDIEAATTVVLRMLDAQPHLSLDATRKAFLLDTGSFTLPDVAPTIEPSTDWTVVSVMLVRRYGMQIASQPVAHETIAAHVTKAAARCSVDSIYALRTVLQGLLGLGCIVEKTLAGGGKCLTINPACLSGPASAFGGFLHVMPPVTRPIPRIDTPPAAD